MAREIRKEQRTIPAREQMPYADDEEYKKYELRDELQKKMTSSLRSVWDEFEKKSKDILDVEEAATMFIEVLKSIESYDLT